jgi:hypothetical protein
LVPPISSFGRGRNRKKRIMKGAERGAACGQRRFHPDPLKEMGIPAPFFKIDV